MSKIAPYWRTESEWVCLNHIPPAKMHKSILRCTYSSCNCHQPVKIDDRIISNILKSASNKCEYYKCSKKKLPGRKYCSDKCRKDKARELYRIRQKLKKGKEENRRMEILKLEERIKKLRAS